MLIIGLTGGIGSGKTTVADLFKAHKVPIVDTDIIARDLVTPGSPALQEIIDRFGKEVLLDSGQLDRKKLAHITFNDESKRLLLESILHPKIRRVMLEQISAQTSPYVIVVIPLLTETGQTENIDRILVVDCQEEIQIARVKQRDNRENSEIISIINSQATRQQRLDVADDIIENTSDLDTLKKNVAQLHHKYLQLARS